MPKIIALIPLFLFFSCSQDYRFEQLISQLETQYQEQFRRPKGQALIIISAKKIQIDLDFCKHQLDALEQFSEADLKQEHQQTKQKYITQLKAKHQQISHYQGQATRYNVGKSIQKVLDHNELPLMKKLSIVKQQLKQTPLYYETAKQNLQQPDGLNAQKALYNHTATFILLTQSLPDSLKYSNWNSNQNQLFRQELEKAILAVKDYMAFCRSLYLNEKQSPNN